MQEATLVDMLNMQDDITVAPPASGGNNVLVEGEGDEDDDGDKVDGGADGAHALRDEGPRRLAHVAAAEAGGNELGAEPADHGVGDGEGEQGEGQRGNEGLAIVVKGVCEDGEGGAGEGDEGEGLGAREVVGRRDGHGGYSDVVDGGVDVDVDVEGDW